MDLDKDILGKTLEEVHEYLTSTSSGLKVRVMEENGESFIGTCDYRMDRINLIIENDVVKEYYLG